MQICEILNLYNENISDMHVEVSERAYRLGTRFKGFLYHQLMDGLVPSHRQQMERSRKRVMKAAKNDYQQGLENQKVRFGSSITPQWTDRFPQARLGCSCLHQTIQEAYYDVKIPASCSLSGVRFGYPYSYQLYTPLIMYS